MHEPRKLLSWILAFTSLVCVQNSVSSILRQHTGSSHFLLTYWPFLSMLPWIFLPFALGLACAWWAFFNAESLFSIWGSILNWRHAAEIRRKSLKRFDLEKLGTISAGPPRAIPGDGTSDLLNLVIPLLLSFAPILAFYWWSEWNRTSETSYLPFMFVLLPLPIITIHELGHTIVGLALGMKLHAFIVGPFQWRVHDSRWKFQFQPKQILMGGGATGMVPTLTDFSRWEYVWMSLGGVVANIGTGITALWFAFGHDAGSQLQRDGSLVLFGIWSLIGATLNLVPFRTKNNYSDGAKVYQILANDLWADCHRAFSLAGASFVTPVRPRDYDIQTIARASRGITHGPYGFYLRLLAYSYFLDKGDLGSAGEELKQAALIYNNSVLDVPGELLTSFVFGIAYISRNGKSARAWWTHMDAKKPLRVGVDYWLAAGALHWVEGAAFEARASLERANTLALQLPKAGAYDFQRYSCALLRHALEEAGGQKCGRT
ncbi:MAG: M50 family metallopeptidase [Acidobacteriota bacterium]